MKAARLPLLSILKNTWPGEWPGAEFDLNEFVEPEGAAADEIGPAMFEDRHNAFAERTQFRRPLFRVGVDLGEIIDVRF